MRVDDFNGLSDLAASDPDAVARSLHWNRADAAARIACELSWECAGARHSDITVAPYTLLAPDLLPPSLQQQLQDKPRGEIASQVFAPGELLATATPADRLEIETQSFDRGFIRGHLVEPRLGRFYPRGFIAGVAGSQRRDIRPLRVIGVNPTQLHIDLAHPLAGHELRLSARILDIRKAGQVQLGQIRNITQQACNGGPGMQARWQGQPTDFFSDEPFLRQAPEPDDIFYAQPRMLAHVDSTASTRIGALYERLLPPEGRILDLMSSLHSHLPEGFSGEVIGVGMNRAEMEANPALASAVVQDLNRDSSLPWPDASFDAAICSLSVEYLVRPFEVFAELARLLRPGAPVIVTFSDRWFPPKVTRVWQFAHPFERPGIVLEYFLREGRFRNLHSHSLRGLPRPPDDPYAAQRDSSDPVFAVWCYRQL